MLSNRVIAHVANAFQGLVFAVSAVALVPEFGLYGFAVSSLVASLAYGVHTLAVSRATGFTGTLREEVGLAAWPFVMVLSLVFAAMVMSR
jgi:hypothetical protein